MDKIFLQGLEVQAVIGIYDWEQQGPRELLIDLELGCALDAASRSDCVEDTVDYAQIADTCRSVSQLKPYGLLEHLAGTLIDALFKRFPLTAISITIHKNGAVEGTTSVGIRLNRHRPQAN